MTVIPFTADQLAEGVRRSLAAGDPEGARDFLRVLAMVDPGRAQDVQAALHDHGGIAVMTADPVQQAKDTAHAAAEAIRTLNHLTLAANGAPGLEYPADIYAIVASLKAATERMPQLFRQLSLWLGEQNAAGKVAHASTGNAALDVATVRDALDGAEEYAEALRDALDHAHNAASGLRAVCPGNPS